MPAAIARVSVCLLLCLVEPAALGQGRQDRDGPEPPSITVRGRAEVAAPPDLAVLRMGTVIQRNQANAAQAEVNQVMQLAIQSIRDLGIPANRIQTAGITLQPIYSQPQPTPRGQDSYEPRIVGYRAGNTVQVRLDDLSLVGRVIDVSVAAGANQLEDLSFQIKDDIEYRRQALTKAAQEARLKAQTIAEALGIGLGGVYQVEEAGAEIIRPQMYGRRAMAMEAAAAPTPVQPGEVRVEASVTVTYLLQGAPANRQREAPRPPATAPDVGAQP